MSSIPAINLAAFLDGSEATQQRIAAEVNEICKRLGFLVVEQHGVEQHIIDAAWAAAHDFFDLPLEQKMASKWGAGDIRPNGRISPRSPGAARLSRTPYFFFKNGDFGRQQLKINDLGAVLRPFGRMSPVPQKGANTG
jgi:isopenicillin N synthase-like dioxygenase